MHKKNSYLSSKIIASLVISLVGFFLFAPKTYAAACDFSSSNTATQITVFSSNPSACAPEFVTNLKANPTKYLSAFYQLIDLANTSESLMFAVNDELYKNTFRFPSSVIDNMYSNMPQAIADCASLPRCDDWKTFILPHLLIGNMYQCPNLSSLSEAELLKSLPYGDYDCTESTTTALAPRASNATIQSILSILGTNTQGWGRRNAARVIGNFAQLPSNNSANQLVKGTMATQVTDGLHQRLRMDKDSNVLNDTIWSLDTFYNPYFPMQPDLESISADTSMDTSVRFRAMDAIRRLVYVKTGVINQHDLNFYLQSLKSDDEWVRSEAAYLFEILQSSQFNTATQIQIVQALQTAYAAETVLTPKVFMAKALDRFNGNTALFTSIKSSYEQTHLANTISDTTFTIKSGLPADQLPAFITLLKNEQKAFFNIMGSTFSTPLSTDNNATMTLIIFATQADYAEYMNAFIGYGSTSGGLYLQDIGTLYTYQRTPAQSSYTVEELIQHEFGHYLSHRYIFPGQWGSPGYFDEAKGWADEGTSEVFAGMKFDASGNYSTPLRSKTVARICSQSFRDLQSLLSQTAGYNAAGVFDYDNGWSLMYYLLTSKNQAALNLYKALRNNTYHLTNFASIAGVPSVTSLNNDWHAAMQSWCNGSTPAPIPTTGSQPTATPVPTATPTPTPIYSGSNVVWTNIINAAANASTLTKTATTTQWDAGAISGQRIQSGNGYAEIKLNNSLLQNRAFGLNHDNTKTDITDIDYALVLQSSGVYIFENGTYKGIGKQYKAGDTFKISVESNVVKYYINGVHIYTSTQAPLYPLFMDTSLRDTNTKIENAKLVSGGITPTPTPTRVPSVAPTSVPTPTKTPTPTPTRTPTSTPTQISNGLIGNYFTNKTLSGTPARTRTDPIVNFNWSTGSPSSLIPVDSFSARWTGYVVPKYSQTYTFYTKSDDGVRLWVNGVQVINNWTNHLSTENKGTISLTAGKKYSIKLEYYESTGSSVLGLFWSSASQTKQTIPQSQLFTN